MHTETPTPTEAFWSPAGRISRATFNLRFVLLLGAIFGSVAWASDGPSLGAGLVMIAALVLILVQAIKRARDGFGTGWWAWPVVIPYVCLLAFLVLAVTPSKGVTETQTPDM